MRHLLKEGKFSTKLKRNCKGNFNVAQTFQFLSEQARSSIINAAIINIGRKRRNRGTQKHFKNGPLKSKLENVNKELPNFQAMIEYARKGCSI